MGLNDSYAQVRSQILLMEPLPPINKVFAMVQLDEKENGVGILPLSTVNSTTLFSATYNVSQTPYTSFSPTYNLPLIPYNNPSPIYNISPTPYTAPLVAMFSGVDNGRQFQFGNKDRPICLHGGFKGHATDKCYKLHGYPPGFKGKAKPPVMLHSLQEFFGERSLSL
jgi:hypothetical protein